MAQVVNGVPFPDDYTKEQIDDYFKKLEGNELPQEETKEVYASDRGLNYVSLDGNIGNIQRKKIHIIIYYILCEIAEVDFPTNLPERKSHSQNNHRNH